MRGVNIMGKLLLVCVCQLLARPTALVNLAGLPGSSFAALFNRYKSTRATNTLGVMEFRNGPQTSSFDSISIF